MTPNMKPKITMTGGASRKPRLVGGVEGRIEKKIKSLPGSPALWAVSFTWIAALGILLLAAPAGAGEAPVLRTQKEKISYGIGVDMARNFKQQGIEFDADILIKGFLDQSSGGKLLMTDDAIRATLNAYQKEILQKRAQAKKMAADQNKKTSDAFFAANGKKEGVVTLPSGLQYKILKAGDGRKPTEADSVECNYRGVLIDGTEFDSSYRTGKPVTLKVAGLIPGWTEALKLMPAGSKWQLFIPPQLAYGERGAGRDIGPNATLIFELDLVAVK